MKLQNEMKQASVIKLTVSIESRANRLLVIPIDRNLEWSRHNWLCPGLVQGTCQMTGYASYIGVADLSDNGKIVEGMSAKLEKEDDGERQGFLCFRWDINGLHSRKLLMVTEITS
jgi:hypothetical protein